MNRWLLACLLCTGILGNAWCENLVVFGAEDYPGICFLKNDEPQGVFPRILAGVSEFSGDTYELHLYPWKRAQMYAERGEGGIAHFSKNAAREEIFDFSNRVYGDRIYLVVLKGHEFIYNDLQDLTGKRIGAKFGASFGQRVDTFFASGAISLQLDHKTASRLNKLLLNRIDVAVVEGVDGDLSRLVEDDPVLIRNQDKFVILLKPLVDDSLHLAFLKTMNRRDALDRFNAGFEKFKKTQSYRNLILNPP